MGISKLLVKKGRVLQLRNLDALQIKRQVQIEGGLRPSRHQIGRHLRVHLTDQHLQVHLTDQHHQVRRTDQHHQVRRTGQHHRVHQIGPLDQER